MILAGGAVLIGLSIVAIVYEKKGIKTLEAKIKEIDDSPQQLKATLYKPSL